MVSCSLSFSPLRVCANPRPARCACLHLGSDARLATGHEPQHPSERQLLESAVDLARSESAKLRRRNCVRRERGVELQGWSMSDRASPIKALPKSCPYAVDAWSPHSGNCRARPSAENPSLGAAAPRGSEWYRAETTRRAATARVNRVSSLHCRPLEHQCRVDRAQRTVGPETADGTSRVTA